MQANEYRSLYAPAKLWLWESERNLWDIDMDVYCKYILHKTKLEIPTPTSKYKVINKKMINNEKKTINNSALIV